MFTGIVQGRASVVDVKGTDSLKTYTLRFPDGALNKLTQGASIAINGTCLTATNFDLTENWAQFDVMHETLRLTNIGLLQPGMEVNFERAASIGDEIGGHLMSGHIFCTAKIAKVAQSGDKHSIYFETPAACQKYLLAKGFVGLNGCSLTIGDVDASVFSVHLIPETLEVTTFSELKAGDLVNLELDPQTQTIVDTVERVLNTKKPA